MLYSICSTTFILEPGQSWKTAALRVPKCVCFFYVQNDGDKMNMEYMNIAIEEAIAAYNENEIPVGAVKK